MRTIVKADISWNHYGVFAILFIWAWGGVLLGSEVLLWAYTALALIVSFIKIAFDDEITLAPWWAHLNLWALSGALLALGHPVKGLCLATVASLGLGCRVLMYLNERTKSNEAADK